MVDLGFNKLAKFPQVLLSMPQLTSLYLAHNAIAELPNLRKMANIEELDVSYNKITKLEGVDLRFLKKLRVLNLETNDLEK